jgi:hypothetical protein
MAAAFGCGLQDKVPWSLLDSHSQATNLFKASILGMTASRHDGRWRINQLVAFKAEERARTSASNVFLFEMFPIPSR